MTEFLFPGRTALLSLFATLAASGCVVVTEPNVEETSSHVVSVRVEAPADTVRVDSTLVLQAIPLNADGTPINGLTPTWTSRNPGRATVNEVGRVLGVSAGVVNIEARISGVAGSIALDVRPNVASSPPLQVTLTPPTLILQTGATGDFVVGISGGPEGAQTSWTCASSNASIASVITSSVGCRATGSAPGSASVTVTVSKGAQAANAGAQVTVVTGG